jgi:hypothetical protein
MIERIRVLNERVSFWIKLRERSHSAERKLVCQRNIDKLLSRIAQIRLGADAYAGSLDALRSYEESGVDGREEDKDLDASRREHRAGDEEPEAEDEYPEDS